ncbi:MAG: hypothetical protein R2684_15930 [Pyrinomonadaceae bacterium]
MGSFSNRELSTLFLRYALAASFLSSVAARFGIWGSGWRTFENFLVYTAKLLPFVSARFVPFFGWAATILEFAFGLLLIAGFRLRETGIASGVLLILFALGMTLGFGIKEPLDYSVFTAAAGSFLLAAIQTPTRVN